MGTRGRGIGWLKGCAIGCGAVMLLSMASCIGFVVWVQQSGEMLEASRLIGPNTAGYAEWELDLDDPGTEQLVTRVLEVLRESRGSWTSGLPPVLDLWLKDWQSSRDEKKIRQMFPMVVAWSMSPAAELGEDLHLVTMSGEALGNRTVLMDWILGFIFARSPDVDVVVHGREKIYSFPDPGFAFFLRQSDILLTSDLQTAQVAVDRLASLEHRGSGELEVLLGGLPLQRPLRIVITNSNGQLQRVMGGIAQIPATGDLGAWNWATVTNMTLAGGFTDDSAFAATMTMTKGDGVWNEAEADRLAGELLTEELREELSMDIRATAVGQILQIDFLIPDLPGQLQRIVEKGMEEFVPAEDPEQ